jgi:hypothetical protein
MVAAGHRVREAVNRRWTRTGSALLLAGCAVTPLTNKIDPGQEPFLVVIGEGRDGQTDLFAANPAGGAFTRVTFSRPAERMARLSPSGTAVAFLREQSVQDTAHFELVVLDLLTTGEERAPLAGSGRPTGLGWSADGSRLFVTAGARFATAAPPGPMALEPVEASEIPRADSATRTLLGDPPFADVIRCASGFCLTTADGDTTRLDDGVLDAFRWGGDSVGLVRSSEIEVRPLGGGRVRRARWPDRPAGLRSASYHPGPAAR